MLNNYPPDARMNEYFNEYQESDRFNSQQDNILNDILKDNRQANLGIVYDQSDGEDLDDRTYPYLTYYDTNNPTFKQDLTNDLLDYNIPKSRINKLFKEAQTYEISDLLEEILPDSKILIGSNILDINNTYIDRYTI